MNRFICRERGEDPRVTGQRRLSVKWKAHRGSPLTVVNSAFTRNSVTVGGGGGAIDTDGAAVPGHYGLISICGTTFSHNSSNSNGGAAYLWSYPPQRIFLGNSVRNPWDIGAACAGSMGKGTHDAQWAVTGPDKSTACSPHVTVKNPRFTAPADNGGPTPTMMPAADSPLLEPGAAACLSTGADHGATRPSAISAQFSVPPLNGVRPAAIVRRPTSNACA